MQQGLNQKIYKYKQIIKENSKVDKYISWLLHIPQGKGLVTFIKRVIIPYIITNIQAGKSFSQIKYELDNSVVPYIKILKNSKHLVLSNITNIADFISFVEVHLTKIRKYKEQDDGIQKVYQYNNGWYWSDVYGYVSLWRLGKILQVPLGALGQNDFERVSKELILILALYNDRNLPIMAIEIGMENNFIQKIISYKDQEITDREEKAYLLDFLIKNWIGYADVELSKILRHGICLIGNDIREEYLSIMNEYDLSGKLLIYE